MFCSPWNKSKETSITRFRPVVRKIKEIIEKNLQERKSLIEGHPPLMEKRVIVVVVGIHLKMTSVALSPKKTVQLEKMVRLLHRLSRWTNGAKERILERIQETTHLLNLASQIYRISHNDKRQHLLKAKHSRFLNVQRFFFAIPVHFTRDVRICNNYLFSS